MSPEFSQAQSPTGVLQEGILLPTVGIFAAVHLLYYALGVRFDTTPLFCFWQFLDPVWLKQDLLRSLWYLHSQPPLLNALVGIALKLLGTYALQGLQAFWVILGFGGYLAITSALVAVCRSRRTAVLLSTLLILQPSFVLFENLLFYPHLEWVCFAFLMYALSLLSHGRQALGLACFVSATAILSLTHSLFHPLFFFFALTLAAWAFRIPLRTLALTAGLPSLLLLGIVVKNAYLFGSPSTSSWLGLNLAGDLKNLLSMDEISALSERGLWTAPLAQRRFSPVATLDEAPSWAREIPALAMPTRPSATTDFPPEIRCVINFNHWGFLALSSESGAAATAVYREKPFLLLKRFLLSSVQYFLPASDFPVYVKLRAPLEPFLGFLESSLFGVVSLKTADETPIRLALASMLLVLSTLTITLLRLSRRQIAAPLRPAVIVACFFSVYLIAVPCLFELWESNRLGYCLSPIILYLLAVVCFSQRPHSDYELHDG